MRSSALKTRTNIHQDLLYPSITYCFVGELCLSWAVSSPWVFPLTSPKSLSPQPHFGGTILSHTSLPCDHHHFQSGSVLTQGVPCSGGQHCCGGTCAKTAKYNSQRITQMSLQLRAWRKKKPNKINSKKANCRRLENDKEMSNNQHGCTRNKSCQTDLILFSGRVDKGREKSNNLTFMYFYAPLLYLRTRRIRSR